MTTSTVPNKLLHATRETRDVSNGVRLLDVQHSAPRGPSNA
jgi:hypothetical protein